MLPSWQDLCYDQTVSRATRHLIDELYTATQLDWQTWTPSQEPGVFESVREAKTSAGSRTSRIFTAEIPAANFILKPEADGGVILLLDWREASRKVYNSCYSSKDYGKIARLYKLVSKKVLRVDVPSEGIN